MTDIYKRAYTEVLEILSHFSKEEYSKIPKEKIEFYEANKDKNYNFRINPKIDLSEQNISMQANAILVLLFRDYFATEAQRETLPKLLSKNQQRLEQKKMQKYNLDNIFNNSKTQDVKEQENQELETSLIKYKDNIFRRFLNKIKGIFRGD